MTDIILEVLRALILGGIVVYLWNAGHTRFQNLRHGWGLILGGFGLLLFGSILDVTDNFDALNRFVIIGDTEVEAVLEKFVGFLGGFLLLAIGLARWIPNVQALSDLIARRTEDLTRVNEDLTIEIEERTKAVKIKNDFLSTVSHELRTPLTSIYASLRLLKDGGIERDSDGATQMIEIAERNSERLLTLVNDLLDVQKLQSGQFEYVFTPFNLSEMLEHAVQSNQPYAEKYGVRFNLTQSVPDIMLNGDQHRLIQVMSNLLSNAAKFSPRDSVVDVSLAVENSVFRVSVSDQGPGIAKEFYNKIFQRFSMSDNSDERNTTGTGLGLFISKSIVEYHGGDIGFVNRPGHGATFYFDLPAKLTHQAVC